jgi:hypothetical protein
MSAMQESDQGWPARAAKPIALAFHVAGARLGRAIWNDLPAIVLVAIYALVAVALFRAYALPPFAFSGIPANATLYLAVSFFGLLGFFCWTLLRDRPELPFRYVPAFLARYRIVERFIASLPALAAVTVLAPFFSAMKSAVPVLNPYAYDALFASIDRTIHGGDAWALIQPLVGYQPVTFAISTAYQLWILLLYVGVWLVSIWNDRPLVRLQFMLAYVASWIVIGTLCATGMSSVGPCFVEHFTGDRTYAPLMAYLAEVDRTYPILALDVQQMLLGWREDGDMGLGRGISAMPSMHVAIATLFAVVAWKFSRAAGIVMTAFLLVIQLGSVHLGYHYAIDGYLAALLALALWYMAGRLAAAWLAWRPAKVPGLRLRTR